MRRWLSTLALLLGLLALAACAAQEKVAPAPAAPAPAAEAKPAWQEEWERTLAAAKREGKVAVYSSTGAPLRQVLTEPFEKRYGISVEFLGQHGAEFAPRLRAEREAGQYLWDVYVQGTSTAFQFMIPLGALEPIEPALILPEVKEPKNWRGGGLEFADKSRRILVMTPFQRGTLFVNPSLVRPEEFRSYKDLLDPRWRGKILGHDPRVPGPGQATFTLFHLHPELGPDFIRALARQELTLLRDFRQETEMLAQGKYPILLGTADYAVEAMVRQGVPIAIVAPTQLREGSDVSPAEGATALFSRAPHPNAAKVYINWLLSKEGQTDYAKAQGYPSGRVDVPTDHVLPWRIPKAGAIKTYDEEAMAVRDSVLALLREVFGR